MTWLVTILFVEVDSTTTLLFSDILKGGDEKNKGGLKVPEAGITTRITGQLAPF